MIGSPVLASAFRVVHLDTSDRRSLATMGRIDLANVALGLLHELQLMLLLRRHRPALTYLTLSQGRPAIVRDWLFTATATLLGSRVVLHLRGSGYADVYRTGPFWLRRLLRGAFRRATRVLVLGEGLLPMARAIDPATPVGVAPNGGPEILSRIEAETPVRGESPPVVAYLGALRRSKGVHDALQVASRVARDVPEVRYVFAGQWPSEDERLQAMAIVRENGLEGTVEFPGAVDAAAKAELLRRSTMYLMASHGEGHPWAVIEAMSAGLPIVATRTGVVPDSVVHGVTGFLADVGDVEGLADGVRRLLGDDDLAHSFSIAARKRYEQLFTMEASHTALVEQLRLALAGRR